MCGCAALAHGQSGWRLSGTGSAPASFVSELMLSTVLDAERQVPLVFKLILSLASHSHHGRALECWSG